VGQKGLAPTSLDFVDSTQATGFARNDYARRLATSGIRYTGQACAEPIVRQQRLAEAVLARSIETGDNKRLGSSWHGIVKLAREFQAAMKGKP